MSNVARFFESWANVSHTVLGVHLQPFCLSHYLFLDQIGSPLVHTAKPCTIADLEVAALVCSARTLEGIQRALSGEALDFVGRFKRARWRHHNRNTDLAAELRKFLAYQDDYLSLPRYSNSDQETEEKLPWLLLAAASVIKSTGWAEETVFSMPLGKVLWLNAAFGYLTSGETSVISDKEAAAEDSMRAFIAQQKALTGGGALYGK